MLTSTFPVIDLTATGNNIKKLRVERGLSVRDLQEYFGFEEPRAIYKWQNGQCLPSVDNLYALGHILEVPVDEILIPTPLKLQKYLEQQAEPCCSNHFILDLPIIIQKSRQTVGLIHPGWIIFGFAHH